MATLDGSNAAFDAAYQSFLHSLPEDERVLYSPCSSAADLLHGLQKLDAFAKRGHKQRQARFLRAIERLGEKLEPFFDIIAIFIQSKPEYSAIVWGSLRLVIKLATNYATFLDKLVKVIGRLGDSLPQYADIVTLYNSNSSLSLSNSSSRMKAHLEKVYTSILQFFQSVARVFTKGHGRIRKTPAVICDLMWTPFDTRFKDLLDQMSYHRNMIRYEVEILQAQVSSTAEESAKCERLYAAEERKLAAEERKRTEEAANLTTETRNLLEKQRQCSIFDRVHRWLRPSNFTDVFESSQGLREEGTGESIFENPEFIAWKSLEWSIKPPLTKRHVSPNVLWYHGNPGHGKTVLASHVIETLRDETCALNSEPEVLYFFFESSKFDTTTAMSAYRAMLSQILFTHRTDYDLIEKFVFARDETSDGQLTASPIELTCLLQCCLISMQQVYLVLDGIDECSDTAALAELLVWMGANTSVKTLLFSRPNVAKLQRMIPQTQRTTVDRYAVSADIKIFLHRQLQDLVEEELLSPIADLSELVDRLVIGADGMFLWARLMVNYLHSPALTPKARLRAILDVVLPEGLEQMYNRILQLISRSSRAEQDLARQVFVWLAYALGPLSLQGLCAALTDEDGVSKDDSAKGETLTGTIKESIVTVCGGLVEIGAPLYSLVETSTFHFIHLSVKEHFIRLASSTRVDDASRNIFPCHRVANFELAARCVEHMDNESRPTHAEIQRQDDFTLYAMSFWTDHLVNAVPAEGFALEDQQRAALRLDTCLKRFLLNPKATTTWIHAYYSTKAISVHVLNLRTDNMESWVKQVSGLEGLTGSVKSLQQLSLLVCEFARDLKLLVSSWGPKLSNDPELIWDEVPILFQSQFLVPNDTRVKSIAPSKPQSTSSSKRPLSSISHTTRDGSLNGALSVWPSQEFEEHWQSLSIDYRDSTYRLCNGWVAKYEVWVLDTEVSRVVDVVLPLKKEEVNLLLRQSLRAQDDGWKSSFPLAISNDLRSVVILRTLYAFELATTTASATMRTADISVNFVEAVESKWREDTRVFDSERAQIQNLPLALKYMHADWYHYTFTFSPCGRYLAFSDHHRFDNQQHIAIFEILREASLSVRMVNWSDCSSGSYFAVFRPQKSILRIAFHPVYDLVVFERAGAINLWHFRDDFCKSTETINSDHKGHAVEFSSCGNYIVLSEKGHSTSVLPIPPQELSRAKGSSDAGDGCAIAAYITAEKTKLTTVGNTNIAPLQLQEGQVLQNSHLIIHEDSEVAGFTSISARDSVDVSFLSQGSIQSTQVMNIITLPQQQQHEIDELVPTIKVPGSRDTTIRVILDKAARSDYSMEDIRSQGHLIVDRPIDKIKHTVTLGSQPAPPPESTKKRPRPLHTNPHNYKIAPTDDEEQQTHAFDASNQIIAEATRQDAFEDAKRLRRMIPSLQNPRPEISLVIAPFLEPSVDSWKF